MILVPSDKWSLHHLYQLSDVGEKLILIALDLKEPQCAHLSGSVSQKLSYVPASSAERPYETRTARTATFRKSSLWGMIAS